MTTAATIGAPSEKTHKPSHAIEADSDVRDLDLFSTIQEDLTEFRSQPNQDDESMFGVGDASLKSGLTSIASTIPDYVYENGRRYHSTSASNYVLPNDEREQERLDLVHYIFRLTLDGDLCYTKLENPQKILDLGTGTGIWAIEIGNEYPSADVIGTDISPIQPGCDSNPIFGTAIPSNVQFQIDDASQEWTFPAASFDFIHIRTLYSSISDYPALLRESYKALKPGGQVEIGEIRTRFFCDDGTYPDDSQTKAWVDLTHRIAGSVGIDLDITPTVPEWLRRAGFTEVEQEVRVVPLGTWPKDRRLKRIGYYMAAQFFESAMDSFTIALFTRYGGYTEEGVRDLLNRVRNELKSNKLHVYTTVSFTVGKRPLADGMT